MDYILPELAAMLATLGRETQWPHLLAMFTTTRQTLGQLWRLEQTEDCIAWTGN